MRIKIIMIVFALFLINEYAIGQERNNNTKAIITVNGGFARTLLSNGSGYQIGSNIASPVSNYIAMEGQISLLYAGGSAFLSGGEFSETVGMLLVGGRGYLSKPENKWRMYFNLLVGGGYSSEDGAIIGISGGLYIAKNQGISLGIAAETTEYVVLKVGYTF